MKNKLFVASIIMIVFFACSLITNGCKITKEEAPVAENETISKVNLISLHFRYSLNLI